MGFEVAAFALSLGLLAPAAWAQPSTPSGDESVSTMSEVRGAGGLRHTLHGRVEDIDMDGTVQIETGNDTFGKDSLKVRLEPEVARQLRKGDPVQLDLTIGSGGAPAASPRTP